MFQDQLRKLRESGEIIACGAYGYRVVRQKSGNPATGGFDCIAVFQFKREKAGPPSEAVAEGPQGCIVAEYEPAIEAVCRDDEGVEWGEFEPDKAFGFPIALAKQIIARIEEVAKSATTGAEALWLVPGHKGPEH